MIADLQKGSYFTVTPFYSAILLHKFEIRIIYLQFEIKYIERLPQGDPI